MLISVYGCLLIVHFVAGVGNGYLHCELVVFLRVLFVLWLCLIVLRCGLLVLIRWVV